MSDNSQDLKENLRETKDTENIKAAGSTVAESENTKAAGSTVTASEGDEITNNPTAAERDAGASASAAISGQDHTEGKTSDAEKTADTNKLDQASNAGSVSGDKTDTPSRGKKRKTALSGKDFGKSNSDNANSVRERNSANKGTAGRREKSAVPDTTTRRRRNTTVTDSSTTRSRAERRALRKRSATEGTFGLTPFVRSSMITADCMFLVILALLPSAGAGIYHYGTRAMFLIGLAVATAIACELIWDLIFRKGWTIFDYSAVVTGLITGLIMPPTAPYRFPVIASAIAIVGAKLCFGGIGKNIFNPAATGKLVLTILFYDWMMKFSTPGYSQDTPLIELALGNEISLKDMLTGNVPGCIGTTSVIAILIGALLLILTGVINLQISLSYLAAFSVFYILFGRHGLSAYFLGAQLSGGSLLFTAFFMANDYTTSPVGRNARLVYGVILGVLTGIIRVFFGQVEMASLFALLIGNAFVRGLDTWLMQKPFGTQQVRRTIRVHAPMPALQRAQGKTPEELANEKIEQDFAEFERTILPQNAATGSETAGTIDSTSVEMHRNRKKIDQGIPPMPEMPVFGATYDPNVYGANGGHSQQVYPGTGAQPYGGQNGHPYAGQGGQMYGDQGGQNNPSYAGSYDQLYGGQNSQMYGGQNNPSYDGSYDQLYGGQNGPMYNGQNDQMYGGQSGQMYDGRNGQAYHGQNVPLYNGQGSQPYEGQPYGQSYNPAPGSGYGQGYGTGYGQSYGQEPYQAQWQYGASYYGQNPFGQAQDGWNTSGQNSNHASAQNAATYDGGSAAGQYSGSDMTYGQQPHTVPQGSYGQLYDQNQYGTSEEQMPKTGTQGVSQETNPYYPDWMRQEIAQATRDTTGAPDNTSGSKSGDKTPSNVTHDEMSGNTSKASDDTSSDSLADHPEGNDKLTGSQSGQNRE